MEIEQEPKFGMLETGEPVTRYTLRNDQGVTAKIINYGATLAELHLPDRDGVAQNVVLGFDNFAQYLEDHPYFGGTVGRVCNRIARAKFSLDGKDYSLAKNAGENHLHGGERGFSKVLWEAEPVQDGDGVGVRLRYRSPAGEEGYPGNVTMELTYRLTRQSELRLDYVATTDEATPVNVTNHSYFNLAGSGSVLDHELMVVADYYTPTNEDLIPTGDVREVKGTPLDFNRPKKVGAEIDQLKAFPGGYDHNYVLKSRNGGFGIAGRLYEPTSGRIMEVYTTEPGMQLYTGHKIDSGLSGVGGERYGPFSGLCLETQHFPDAVNHPQFPSIILHPGKELRSSTVFNFSAR